MRQHKLYFQPAPAYRLHRKDYHYRREHQRHALWLFPSGAIHCHPAGYSQQRSSRHQLQQPRQPHRHWQCRRPYPLTALPACLQFASDLLSVSTDLRPGRGFSQWLTRSLRQYPRQLRLLPHCCPEGLLSHHREWHGQWLLPLYCHQYPRDDR
ncbi:hypothetical protein BvCms1174_01155 [Escherichia coli]|nr:hypothetical protein BvCms1174_01155 [Escherichia coli]